MKRIGLLLLMLALAQLALAQPTTVQAGFYVLNIGKFDVSTGSYTVDFYLSLKCDQFCEPDFEFMNGRATSVDKLIDKPDEKFYRIQAALTQNIDLKRYPLDSHSLSIVLEDKKKTANEQVFEIDNASSGIDPEVTLVGWNLKGWDAKVDKHFYAPYDEEYSRLYFNVDIERIRLSAVLKAFLPVLFIVLTGLLALLIEEKDKLWTRLGVNTSSVIAAVMFHLNVTSSIPPVGYLTIADKFMIATYVVLLASLFSSIELMVHAKHGDEELSRKIYRISLYGIPAMALVLYVFVFVLE